jgi:pilus assembly protein CpaE
MIDTRSAELRQCLTFPIHLLRLCCKPRASGPACRLDLKSEQARFQLPPYKFRGKLQDSDWGSRAALLQRSKRPGVLLSIAQFLAAAADPMRILIVSDSLRDPIAIKVKEALALLAGNHRVDIATFNDARKTCCHFQPQLVLVIVSPCPDRGLELISQLRGQVSGRLVAVGQIGESRLILRALRCGADHYLDHAELESELKVELSCSLNKPPARVPAASLLAILSASGGCGASTVAVNVAATLAREHEQAVLIDLHLHGGDAAALLDLKTQFTLADLCRNVARLDESMFEKILAKHSSGIRLLSAPLLFSDFPVINAQGIIEAVNIARRCYSHVVIDLDDCFHNEQVITLHQATGILVVCRLDFTSLRNARRILDHLDKQDISRSRIRLLINQFGKPGELPVNEAENALGEKLALFVPNDPKTIAGANNAGVPAVIKEPGTKVAQSLGQLAKIDFEKLNGTMTAAPKAAGPLTLEFRRKS